MAMIQTCAYKPFLDDYKIDVNNRTILDGQDSLVNCWNTAIKIHKTTEKKFNFFDWISFYLLDSLAGFFSFFKSSQFCQLRDMIFDSYVSKHFLISDKNVADLRNAQVICIGEAHDSDFNRRINGNVINFLSRTGDLVLTERPSSEELRDHPWTYWFLSFPIASLPKQDKYVEGNLETKGWDLGRTSYFPPLPFVLILSTVCCVTYPFYSVTYSFFEERINSPRLISYVGSFLLLGLFIISEKIEKKIKEKMGLQEKESFLARNRYMCQVIEKNLLNYNRIFVLGGAAHFERLVPSKDPFAGKIDTDEDKGIAETKKYLQGKKFAILTPRLLFDRPYDLKIKK